MASDFSWAINGIPFDTAFGPLFVTDASMWRPQGTTRRTTVTIPGSHGVLSPGLPVYDEAEVNLVLRSRQATQAALEEAVNQAIAILSQPIMTLTRVSGTLTTSAVVQRKSLTTDADFVYAKTAKIVAVLAVSGAFFREAIANGADIAFTSDLVNTELPLLSGSTGPISDAVIRITGPATTVSITDPGTGTGLSWTGTLTAGQYLFLSAKPLSGRISSTATDWLSGGTDQSHLVSFPAAGRLQLCPVVQSATVRKILVNASGAGRSAATKLAVRAGRCFL